MAVASGRRPGEPLPDVLYKGMQHFRLDDIRESGGLKAGVMGESGPGTYLTDDIDHARKFTQGGSRGGAILHIQHQIEHPLIRGFGERDRSGRFPGDSGDDHYRELQAEAYGHTGKPSRSFADVLKDHGYDSVESHFPWGHEIAVHDPSKLTITHVEHTDSAGKTTHIEPWNQQRTADKQGIPGGMIFNCACGLPVEFDPIDGWQHADGSISHDGEFYGKSVSDLMGAPPALRRASLDALHRGISVEVDPETLIERHAAGGLPAVHQHIADLALKHPAGMGTHWTSRLDIARQFASGSSYSGPSYKPSTEIPYPNTMHVPVVIHGHIDREHHETDPEKLRGAMVEGHGWTGLTDKDERETLVHSGAPVRVTHVEAALPLKSDWVHRIPDHQWAGQREWDEQPHSWQPVAGAGQYTASVAEHAATRFTPDKRVFSRTCGLDHRLFDANGQLKPEVRTYVLASVSHMWWGKYVDWSKWARIYFAGSEASEWTGKNLEGNADFDVLIGVDYDAFRAANPLYSEMSNQHITDEMNQGFRPFNGPATIWVDGIGTGPWDRTTYVNADSYDIRAIRPYAAYDVGRNIWIVKPPHLPHWDFTQIPKAVQLVLRSSEQYVKRVLKLPEPQRTQEGNRLFQDWHSDRSEAFGPRGEGWWDIANLREKYLDQEGLWAQLVDCAHRAKEGLDLASQDWSSERPFELTSALDQLSIDAANEVGRKEHPNVDHYQSGGIGHLEGDETRSVVGFMPTRMMRRYREHSGEWNGEHSQETVDSIRHDLREGKGITNPLMVEYDHKLKWGYLGEGNHRLRAASDEGLHTVPVRVVRNSDLSRRKAKGIGAPMELQTNFGEHDPHYVPSDMHPYHFVKSESHEAKLPKTEKCEYCDKQATERLLWAEGMAYIPCCDEHESNARHRIVDTNKDEVVSVCPIEKTSSRAEALYGSNDIDSLFHGGVVTTVPFPPAGRSTKREDYDHDLVRDTIANPDHHHMADVDPRELRATQPTVTRAGIQHYLGSDYEHHGTTYADMDNAGNRRPVVYHREDGQKLILSGHHRAVAALIQGKPLQAVNVHGPYGKSRHE